MRHLILPSEWLVGNETFEDSDGAARRWLEPQSSGANRAKMILARLEDSGIAVPQHSRLHHYLRQQQLLSGDEVINIKELDERLELLSLAELKHWSLITRELCNEPHLPQWRKLLQAAVCGPDLAPASARSDDSTRSFQFELFLASALIAAKYSVQPAEPDLVIHLENVPIGIAAKRLRSHANVAKNIRRAIRQIRNAGMKGIVALDLAFPEVLSCSSASFGPDLTRAAAACVQHFIDRHILPLQRLFGESECAGVLIHVCRSALGTSGRIVSMGTSQWWDYGTTLTANSLPPAINDIGTRLAALRPDLW